MWNLNALPVLKYHQVNDDNKDVVTIAPELFEKQLIVLKEMGYRSIFLPEFEDCLYNKKSIPERLIALTFDDGFYDNYKFAFPLLKKHDFVATIFLSTSFIKERSENKDQKVMPEAFKSALLNGNFSGFLNWEQVDEMAESGLIDFEPHTHFHRHRFCKSGILSRVKDPAALPFKTISCFDMAPKRGNAIYRSGASLITRAYNPKIDSAETKNEYMARICDEIRASKDIIEEKFDKNCYYLAWPWGLFNGDSIRTAKSLEFKLLFTTFYGSNHILTPKEEIKRFTPTTDMNYFKEEILRNSYLPSSLCVDNKLYNLFCRRYILKKLKES